MATFTPHLPYNVPAYLLTPTTEVIKGVPTKSFVVSDEPIYCNFRSFGGTEREVNGVTVVENTATVETWYDPDITSDCNIRVNGVDYEVLGAPENIEMRNQYLVFKVRAVEGGA